MDKRIRRWAVGLVSQPANAGVRAIGRLGVSIYVIRCRIFYLYTFACSIIFRAYFDGNLPDVKNNPNHERLIGAMPNPSKNFKYKINGLFGEVSRGSGSS